MSATQYSTYFLTPDDDSRTYRMKVAGGLIDG